ncbi:MAG: hypothetical protein WA008_09800 [Saprospiraceae bacterium]
MLYESTRELRTMEEIMEARTEYEKMIIKEVGEMPGKVLPQVVKIILSLKVMKILEINAGDI